MRRRDFLKASALGAAAGCATSPGAPPAPELEEATVAGLQDAMKAGRETSASITKKYLERIAEWTRAPPRDRVNPDAVSIARALDEERASKGPRTASRDPHADQGQPTPTTG
jgi:hypothetical protein